MKMTYEIKENINQENYFHRTLNDFPSHKHVYHPPKQFNYLIIKIINVKHGLPPSLITLSRLKSSLHPKWTI